MRIGVAAAMTLAASTVVFAGQAAAQDNGCASEQPRWNYVCLPAVSNVSLAYCQKNGPGWDERGICVARWDNGRYDYWIPRP
ncbi:hypothetical protein [Nocardia brasiliensis]|uniref:hypothetical protein n=1 Tax=Nocardia brasiliensis TaxID=37326 RepID=UPI0036709A90